MVQLMPLPSKNPTISCLIKIQKGFIFVVLNYSGCLGKKAVRRVSDCLFVLLYINTLPYLLTYGEKCATASQHTEGGTCLSIIGSSTATATGSCLFLASSWCHACGRFIANTRALGGAVCKRSLSSAAGAVTSLVTSFSSPSSSMCSDLTHVWKNVGKYRNGKMMEN